MPESPAPTRAEPRHLVVLVSLFILLTVAAGCTNYSLPLYLQHLTNDRHLSLSGVSFGTTVFFICGSLAALPTGRLLLRVQPRTVMLAGGIAGGTALGLLGLSHALWQAYPCYAIMGAAFSAGGALPAATAVLRISSRTQRARMLAASTVGLSAGGFIVTPLASILIDSQGLTVGLLVLGLFYAGSATAVMTLLMPAVPAGVPVTAETAIETAGTDVADLVSEPEAEHHMQLRAAAASGMFWLLAGCFILFFAAQIGSTNHIIRMASDRGLGHLGVILPIVTVFAVVGRLVGSVTLQRYSIWTVLIGVFFIELVATVGLAFTHSVPALFVSAAFLGVAIGHTPVVQPIAIAELFGVTDYPRIAAVMSVLTSLGLGGGPVLVSVVHNSTSGSWGLYRAGYLVLSACAAIACGLAVVIAIRSSRPVAPASGS